MMQEKNLFKTKQKFGGQNLIFVTTASYRKAVEKDFF